MFLFAADANCDKMKAHQCWVIMGSHIMSCSDTLIGGKEVISVLVLNELAYHLFRKIYPSVFFCSPILPDIWCVRILVRLFIALSPLYFH